MTKQFNVAKWKTAFDTNTQKKFCVSYTNRNYTVNVDNEGDVLFVVTGDLPDRTTPLTDEEVKAITAPMSDYFRALVIYGYPLTLIAGIIYGVMNDDEIAKAFNVKLPDTIGYILERFQKEFYTEVSTH